LQTAIAEHRPFTGVPMPASARPEALHWHFSKCPKIRLFLQLRTLDITIGSYLRYQAPQNSLPNIYPFDRADICVEQNSTFEDERQMTAFIILFP
jgi:hypothetical protein